MFLFGTRYCIWVQWLFVSETSLVWHRTSDLCVSDLSSGQVVVIILIGCTTMKFPLFNLGIFKRSSAPSSTPTNRATTTIGKRKSSSSGCSKSGTTHRRTSRKRSITYYSPSKSRFYPTEYFPTLQCHQLTAAASTDVAATGVCDANAIKLNHNRTYLCNDQDVIVHHDAAWLPHQHSHQNKQIDPQFYAASELYEPNDSNNNNVFVQKFSVNRDYNANSIAVDDNVIVLSANQFDPCTQECMGSSSSAFIMPNSHSSGDFYVNLKCESSQQQPSFHRTAHQPQQQHFPANHLNTHNTSVFNNSGSGAIRNTNNINRLFDGVTHQYANSSNAALFHHSTMPIMKKHERHRRRKVCCVRYALVLVFL